PRQRRRQAHRAARCAAGGKEEAARQIPARPARPAREHSPPGQAAQIVAKRREVRGPHPTPTKPLRDQVFVSFSRQREKEWAALPQAFFSHWWEKDSEAYRRRRLAWLG